MALLSALADNVRRKMGLGLGSHTVTLVSVLNTETINVHGITLSALSTPVDEVAGFSPDGNDTADAASLAALINAIFDDSTGVSATSSANVVTITGAYKVTSDDSTFTITATSSADEPPFASDIDQWILDGQLDVTNKSADEVLTAGDSGKMLDQFSVTGADGSATALAKPTDFLRAIAVSGQLGSDSKNYVLNRVSPGELLQIQEGTHSRLKTGGADGDKKWWSIYNEKIQFSEAPVNSSTPFIIGIKKPQTTKATASDLPDHLLPLVEDYAVIIAWQQRQRLDIAAALFQKYIADIGTLNAVYQTR